MSPASPSAKGGGQGATSSSHGGSSSTSSQELHSHSSEQATQKSSYPRPWVHREDALLLLYMAGRCDLKEHGYKLAGFFSHHGKAYGVPSGPDRDYDEIVERCKKLMRHHRQYDIVLQNSRAWEVHPDRHREERLWDFDHVTAARRWPAIWEDSVRDESPAKIPEGGNETGEEADKTKEAASEGKQKGAKGVRKVHGPEREAPEREGGQSQHGQQGEAHGEDVQHGSGSEVNSSKSSKSSEREDEEEEDAGGEDVSHVSGSSQQQHNEDQHAGKKKEPTDQSTRSLKRKKEKTLLVKADRKRMRIGIAPKGTKVTYFPTNGSVEIIF